MEKRNQLKEFTFYDINKEIQAEYNFVSPKIGEKYFVNLLRALFRKIFIIINYNDYVIILNRKFAINKILQITDGYEFNEEFLNFIDTANGNTNVKKRDKILANSMLNYMQKVVESTANKNRKHYEYRTRKFVKPSQNKLPNFFERNKKVYFNVKLSEVHKFQPSCKIDRSLGLINNCKGIKSI